MSSQLNQVCYRGTENEDSHSFMIASDWWLFGLEKNLKSRPQ